MNGEASKDFSNHHAGILLCKPRCVEQADGYPRNAWPKPQRGNKLAKLEAKRYRKGNVELK